MKKDPSYHAVHIVKMSSAGHVVIPKEVRKRLLFHRDTDLVLLESGEVLVLLKKVDAERILRDESAPLLQASERVLGDLWENSEDDVWNDV
jgi:bifunctional DNA-binding transcriptional regulator/antitoxin component of YhaV-PrlF toxin-antitoxin module